MVAVLVAMLRVLLLLLLLLQRLKLDSAPLRFKPVRADWKNQYLHLTRPAGRTHGRRGGVC